MPGGQKMIEGLCNQIWGQEKFQTEYNYISYVSSNIKFENHMGVNFDADILKRLLECGLIFSLSSDTFFRKAAYELAICLRNIINLPEYDCFRKLFQASISLIFSRIGNFPAENKYLEETGIELDDILPQSLWFERESHIEDNSIYIDGMPKLTMTDFQLDLWTAVSNYPITIVNAPTSTGKSFILQNHVIDCLKRNVSKNILYIVPTRALIEQVIKEFKVLLKKDEKNFDINITEVPNVEDSMDKNIFVLTQERVQMLLEHNTRVDLAIIDEAQNLSDGARGIILQSVIETIKKYNKNAKFIFATPYVKNPEVFLQLFNFEKEDCRIIPVGETPVLQNLYNIIIKKDNLYNIEIQKMQTNGEFSHICEMASEYELIDERKFLAQIPLRVGHNQNNIIYGNDPSVCENIANLIAQALADKCNDINELDSELCDFSEYIKEHIHKDYLLAETIKHGVAYHYGNLPTFIRKGIERLCSSGKIKYMVCTSTLLQGLNLPAQNIFIMNPSKGYKNRTPIPLTAPEFWNLAGRAGRLTKDFEGNIFLINISKWDENPLQETDRRQVISPSFKKYVCDPEEGLQEYIDDANHKSGDANKQGLENSFMKLLMLNEEEQLEEVMSELGSDITIEQKERIVAAIKRARDRITLPYEVYSKNPNVSAYRQQELYEYMKMRSSEKGIRYLIPSHPMLKYKEISSDYVRLFVKYDKYFSKVTNRAAAYFSNLALLWMRGASYSDLLKSRIEHKNRNRSRGMANVNTEARGLFEDIEFSIRFKYVKFSKCYNDILLYVMQEQNQPELEKSIPPIHLYLELGGSSATVINLIGMGFSRTTASQIIPHMISSTMNREEIKKWFSQNNIYSMGLPNNVIKEIEQII